jgi:hypothetical protein
MPRYFTRLVILIANCALYSGLLLKVWSSDSEMSSAMRVAYSIAPFVGIMGFAHLRKFEIHRRSGDPRRDTAFANVLWLSVAIAVFVITCAVLLPWPALNSGKWKY